jgi:regulator of replication initiation timing
MTAIKDIVDLIADLKKRVENRKFLADLRQIESNVSKLHLANAGLVESNQALKAENTELKAKIAMCEKQMVEAKASRTQLMADLDEMSEKMLLVMAKSSECITKDEAIRILGLEKARGEYCLDQLAAREFIRYSRFSAGERIPYYVTPAGREYLMKRGLI